MQSHWQNTPQGVPRMPVRMKVQIIALGMELEIELKENRGQYELVALQSPGDFVNRSGNAWHASITDIAAVHEVGQLLKQCYHYPGKPERICILDCTTTRFDAVIDGEPILLKIKDYPPMEAQLVERLLQLCAAAIPDDSFRDAVRFLGRFRD